jgi:hypothetical protein
LPRAQIWPRLIISLGVGCAAHLPGRESANRIALLSAAGAVASTPDEHNYRAEEARANWIRLAADPELARTGFAGGAAANDGDDDDDLLSGRRRTAGEPATDSSGEPAAYGARPHPPHTTAEPRLARPIACAGLLAPPTSSCHSLVRRRSSQASAGVRPHRLDINVKRGV